MSLVFKITLFASKNKSAICSSASKYPPGLSLKSIMTFFIFCSLNFESSLSTSLAVVFEKLPKTFNGYPVINGDNSDYRPMDGKNVVVGLKVKKTSTMVENNKFVIPKNRFIVRYDDKRCKK